MMAIEVVGAIYCPLSPRDPPQRLHALVQQTQSHLVLVHWLTKAKFHNDSILVDIDLLLINNKNNIQSDADIDRLSNVSVTLDHVAYIIFTSGSTGTPKAVSHHIHNELALYRSLIFHRPNFDIEI
jgi:non-ribosomal peptide synthetase component F